MGSKNRVYLELPNRNWKLPIQVCALLQQDLNVPVQLIQWGHPNTREPNQNRAKGSTWAREHQIKIFAEAFLPIGFYVKYKQEILEEFSEHDKKRPGNINKCNPNPRIRQVRKKPKHIEENNSLLPTRVRGKHFNTYWQICLALGCKQCFEPMGELFTDEENNEEN
jgi:hypothetical protein